MACNSSCKFSNLPTLPIIGRTQQTELSPKFSNRHTNKNPLRLKNSILPPLGVGQVKRKTRPSPQRGGPSDELFVACTTLAYYTLNNLCISHFQPIYVTLLLNTSSTKVYGELKTREVRRNWYNIVSTSHRPSRY